MDINQLCRACWDGDNSLVQAIMDTGEVDVNGTDQYGGTPLYCAMDYNQPSVVTTLLSSADTRLDVTSYGETGLHTACYNNNVSVIKLFCSDARCTPAILNMQDTWGNTALMLAVEQGHLETVRELVTVQGIDIGTKNSEGRTALMIAVELGQLDAVQEMARVKGTDFGTVNSEGQTLLEVARQQNHAEMLQFLGNVRKMGKHYFVSQLRTLEEIAAFNIAKHITCESDAEKLEIPPVTISLVTMFLGTHSGD
eukprot:GFUD01023786.1.p1 GENE.GFUD01023786.1~~GFUD01023786.1.p1  ORF type:complete len:253 (+),score=68.48 GFUD01023786.1:228-986(+)